MTMKLAHWQRLSALFDEAMAMAAEGRAGWLADLAGKEPALAAELAGMLALAGDQDVDETVASDAPPQALPEMGGFTAHLQRALQDAPAVENAAQAGLRLGPWMLLHKIGEGGMGQVWLARRADGLYDAQAAIKLLRSDLNAASLQARFARERSVLARLNHPAVARLFDAGIEHGQAYLVLEHVQGRNLVEHVRSHCPLMAQRVRLMLRIAEAVDHAHAQLIVHRDLKPSNVMVTPGGEPKLLDFGIAGLLDDSEPAHSELTRQTGRGLTLGYAAPEQILGEPIGTAADVFSLGVMLYELASGQLPFMLRGCARLAAEQAVLHGEPQRLSVLLKGGALPEADVAQGPGRPSDAWRVAGDLEAIVAQALRKAPAERYGSVRLLMADLEAWLQHRPVQARREDLRHRSWLWLQRHAVLAAAAAAVLLSLGAGLTATAWQAQRAERAARQSDQVTTYLTELLASASPERHGGNWPTVLQLLDSSRASLPDKFRDDPETRLRLLQVLGDTYHQLNRFDVAMPLREEQVALATRLFGADDPRTLAIQLEQARSLQVQGVFDQAIALLEPLRPRIVQAFGAQSEQHRLLLYILTSCYARVGRLDDADRVLTEAGRLTTAAFGPGSLEWLNHQNHLQVLRTAQGRWSDAQAILRSTQPYWTDPAVAKDLIVLVLRRNTLTVKLRLSQYDGIDALAPPLLAEMDQRLGPGNDLAAGLRNELARGLTDAGRFREALAQRQQILALAQAAGVQNPTVLLPMRASLLLAQAQAHTLSPEDLRRQTRALLAELQNDRARIGYARADVNIFLMRVGLLLDDAALAGEALAALKADTQLHLERDASLATRVALVEGELARLRGDFPRSKTLLQQRVAFFERGGDQQMAQSWTAALDLTWTLVLMRDPAASAALDRADARRPAGMPAQSPLDRVAAYLRARLLDDRAGARTASPATRLALATLVAQQGQPPETSVLPAPVPGLGSFSGAFN
jgi:serine/threonine-protein kinase